MYSAGQVPLTAVKERAAQVCDHLNGPDHKINEVIKWLAKTLASKTWQPPWSS